ncbi:hypothetical protein [Desulfosarcina sp.]|uniref:hypothetical protein n=1 Tax=Desulfosarcina sp. TaxID=2027861 RepID=UPI003970870C
MAPRWELTAAKVASSVVVVIRPPSNPSMVAASQRKNTLGRCCPFYHAVSAHAGLAVLFGWQITFGGLAQANALLII